MKPELNYYSIPFSEDIFENPYWPPGNELWLFEEEREKALEAYKSGEQKVVFEGVRVSWESCDCGDGYGCSHANWPYEINFDYDKSAQVDFVDDGIEIVKEGVGVITFLDLKQVTVGQFMDALKTLNIEIKLKKHE